MGDGDEAVVESNNRAVVSVETPVVPTLLRGAIPGLQGTPPPAPLRPDAGTVSPDGVEVVVVER